MDELDYEQTGEQASELVKVDILLHGEAVDAFSAIVHKDRAYSYGVAMAQKLKDLIPRQQFEVPIQAAIGSRIIARESIRAIRKDVLAKCYGGDISRKRKTAREAERGQEADEDGGSRRSSAGSLHRCVIERRTGYGQEMTSAQAKVLAVNLVHEIRPDPYGDVGRTAIDKRAVSEPVMLIDQGPEGDTKNHGSL